MPIIPSQSPSASCIVSGDKQEADVEQVKFGTIKRWCQLSGVSRTKTYSLLGDGSLIGIKLGKRLLIDIELGLAWLRTQPRAQINCGRPRKMDHAA